LVKLHILEGARHELVQEGKEKKYTLPKNIIKIKKARVGN